MNGNPIVIDVPFKKLEMLEEERCVNVGPSGARCIERRMDGQQLCDMHGQWQASVPAVMGLPFPEDAVSLQRFLAKMLDLVMLGRVRPNVAKQTESLVKMLFKNAGACEWEMRNRGR
jgi:hypothetical protein